MIPISTIVPIAIAMPDKATMFASTPKVFMAMKHINTASGNKAADQDRAAQMQHHHQDHDDRDENFFA